MITLPTALRINYNHLRLVFPFQDCLPTMQSLLDEVILPSSTIKRDFCTVTVIFVIPSDVLKLIGSVLTDRVQDSMISKEPIDIHQIWPHLLPSVTTTDNTLLYEHAKEQRGMNC